jgi:hypothetical protein
VKSTRGKRSATPATSSNTEGNEAQNMEMASWSLELTIMHSINFTLINQISLWLWSLGCVTDGSDHFHHHNWREKPEDTVILHSTSSMKDGCSNPQVGKEGRAWYTLTEGEKGNCKKWDFLGPLQRRRWKDSPYMDPVWNRRNRDQDNSTFTSINIVPAHNNPTWIYITMKS